jgi:hypothetical protein
MRAVPKVDANSEEESKEPSHHASVSKSTSMFTSTALPPIHFSISLIFAPMSRIKRSAVGSLLGEVLMHSFIQ